MLSRLRKFIHRIRYNISLVLYWNKLPKKVAAIRCKDTIRVLFIVSKLDSWKTEMLFKLMSSNNRFQPVLGVLSNMKYPNAKTDVIAFLTKSKYNYTDLDYSPNSIKDLKPDIVFYDAPYTSYYSKGHSFLENLEFVFCGVDYCLNITKHEAHLKHPWYDYCWQFYVEHKDVEVRKKEILGRKAKNIRVTGVPIQDTLFQPKTCFPDPWKDKSGKKRIIYAPHHSFKGSNGDGIEFATFMDYGELMLNLAKKYQDRITVAFKPHPILYSKLLIIWGSEKTESYYNAWKNMSNTQFENGEYFGLFKHSDAIIHDCASFIVEYLYIDNPSLYLVSESNNLDDMFNFVRDGYECYEHAQKIEDIERFIQDVISGKDNNRDQRHSYIKNELMPPGGKSACENIINSILFG